MCLLLHTLIKAVLLYIQLISIYFIPEPLTIVLNIKKCKHSKHCKEVKTSNFFCCAHTVVKSKCGPVSHQYHIVLLLFIDQTTSQKRKLIATFLQTHLGLIILPFILMKQREHVKSAQIGINVFSSPNQ